MEDHPMTFKKRRCLVWTVTLMMMAGPALPILGSNPADDLDSGRSFGPLAEVMEWTDPLDDSSHVFVPDGGLVGVEVSGGNAHLKAGSDEGWIASEVISVPGDHRYDLVLVEATTPGNSRVEVSVLNATEEAGEVGFANGTVPGFKLRSEQDLNVYSVDPAKYPLLRVQVNLYADGADRPTLDAWSLLFIGMDEWRDEFYGPGKMEEHKGLNFTGSGLEVNLTGGKSGGGGTGDYEAYPTIAVAAGNNVNIIYPNPTRTGYQDKVNLGSTTNYGVAFEELNGDGYIDLVVASSGGTTKILWGSASGTYSNTGAKDLSTDNGYKVDTGDFNGDGWYDLAVSSYGTGTNGYLFLNGGSGDFGSSPDITITAVDCYYVKTGDVNGDGFDDVLFSYSDTSVFYGGASGVDGTSDATLTGIVFHVGDLDGDGIDDVITRGTSSVARVYIGGSPDIDETADYSLSSGASGLYGAAAGDVNGDGFVDIALITYSGGSYKTEVYEGASDGWSDSRIHDFTSGYGVVKVGDVDKDGYGDIAMALYLTPNDALKVYKGGTSWPSNADITKTIDLYYDLDLAIPSGGGGARAYRGSLTTEAIMAPAGKQWDILYLEGDTPKNTSITITVLDSTGKPIQGYEDLTTMDVDLGGIDPSRYNPITVRVTLASEFNNTTPTIDMLTVKWMDKMTWRDEMYGMAKIDRLLNLEVRDLALGKGTLGGSGPQLMFPSVRGDEAYNTRSLAFFDAGGLDYVSGTPWSIQTRGASAVDVADVNGDGLDDMVFAVHRTTNTTFVAKSPLFITTPMGVRDVPDHEFDTTGALDVLLEDLDGDGNLDVVFAQEQNDGDFFVDSLLYWGRDDGTWPPTADVSFDTTGASDVDSVDVDGDGLLDLVFANHKGTSFTTDSMVFLQNATGFNGSSPSFVLQTRGARAVASGDLNGDLMVDLVFANYFYGGFTQIDSFIYWGKAGGGFMPTPTSLPTVGAEDVAVADLDGDTHLDIVFANSKANSGDRAVDSYVYLNDGTGGFSTTPDATVPTVGAVAVEVMDLDGTGLRDLVFACDFDGSTYDTPSLVFLGGFSGWGSSPDMAIPTVGATDVAIGDLTMYGSGGYLSRPITVSQTTTGSFHTFRYSADLGTGGQSGEVRLVDALTWEVLASTVLTSGTDVEWNVEGLVKVKAHSSIRVMLVLDGLDDPASLRVDDLWLNWTLRVKRPPEVLDVTLAEPSVMRGKSVSMRVNVSDEYDLPEELVVTVQHRVNGTGTWASFALGELKFKDGSWWVTVSPKLDAEAGSYDFRVTVEDKDAQYSAWLELPNMLGVLNNPPSLPVIIILPTSPVSTSTLRVEITKEATDLESPGVSYHYRWFKNGVLQENLTGNSVSYVYTAKGQNWSVEVRAFDGDDEGPAVTMWAVINNAEPSTKNPLPDPELYEDTPDSDWLNLANAFEDADGDALTWAVVGDPEHLEVTIDQDTGQVTIVPEADWSGSEQVTFSASDGVSGTSQTVTVTVLPVNDIPWISHVDGLPLMSDPVEYTVRQGQVLVITIGVMDKEGHDVLMSVNSSLVTLNEVAGTITFTPDNEAVGTLRFGLKIYDTESPTRKVSLNFTIVIEDENDEMDPPQITNPLSGAKFKVDQTFSLVAICFDPDVQYGQVLNFTWTSNISGVLGWGSSLTVSIADAGTHFITVTVRDPDFVKEDSIEIYIEPKSDVGPPQPPADEDETASINWALIVGIVAVLGILGAVLFIVAGKRRTEAYEAKMDTQMEEEEKRESLKRARNAIKDLADEWEGESKAEAAGWEVAADGAEYEEMEVGAPVALTMEAKVTEGPSEDVAKLWSGISATDAARSEEDKEALQLENLKRKYQNAIGRLPYGIPSKELQGMDWVVLANALATGAKKKVEGGKEVTLIDGRWYYSDNEDTGTFLKEHGAKPKEAPRRAQGPTTDREALLSKLEERFILGEISEESYRDLKRKYEGRG
jgi:hypothetical protein